VTYILDTNIISALMRGDDVVADRLARVERSDVRLPQPALAEIAYGIALLPPSKRRDRLENRRAIVTLTVQRSEWTEEVSDAFGRIKAILARRGELIEDFDIAIAAHAVAANGVLVTTDARHMPRIPGLTIEDWSEP
jgi:tRNA(fMet)-specific endonuclease VapC